jgi:hypothetical protein
VPQTTCMRKSITWRAEMGKSFLAASIFLLSFLLSSGAMSSEGSERSQQGNKRVVGYRDDAILAKRWAVLQDDDHPEAPHTLVSVTPPSGGTQSQDGPTPTASGNRQSVVHAGDLLTLFEDSPTLHLELAAVAIESAAQGGHLRVRLVRGGAILNGVVLSPHRVKLQSMAEGFDTPQGTMR